MRSKAPLSLMEQMVMLLVFALAAALCLQAFVKSDQISRQSEARDQAVVRCQELAEIIQYGGQNSNAPFSMLEGMGNARYNGPGEPLELYFGEGWTTMNGVADASYYIRAQELDSGTEGLGKALVEAFDVTSGDAESRFAVEVSWQKEVGAHG